MEDSDAAELRRGLAIVVYNGHKIHKKKKQGIFAGLLHDCYQRSLDLIEVRLIKHRATYTASLAAQGM